MIGFSIESDGTGFAGSAALGNVGSDGTGFDCAGAGGSVFVAKGSGFAALGSVGSGGTGFNLADVPSDRLELVAVGAGA